MWLNLSTVFSSMIWKPFPFRNGRRAIYLNLMIFFTVKSQTGLSRSSLITKNRYKLNGLRSESKRWNHPKGFHPFLYYVLHKRFRCLEKSELPFLNQNSIYSFYAPKNLKGAKPVYFDPHVCTSKHLLVLPFL